ncbi:hypothetical protein VTJ49DRAFT_4362 [Mycothermus thermophilus]|uniref:Uncharacterized protein n=1 Tax=Humicola insolens TaxID=85995 RepID=A0ABR3VLF6_HUMIN
MKNNTRGDHESSCRYLFCPFCFSFFWTSWASYLPSPSPTPPDGTKGFQLSTRVSLLTALAACITTRSPPWEDTLRTDEANRDRSPQHPPAALINDWLLLPLWRSPFSAVPRHRLPCSGVKPESTPIEARWGFHFEKPKSHSSTPKTDPTIAARLQG